MALVDAETGKEIARLTGADTNAFEVNNVDCTDWQGKKALIRIVDESTGPWGAHQFRRDVCGSDGIVQELTLARRISRVVTHTGFVSTQKDGMIT